MQNLIDKISEIEAATASIREKADERKKEIEAQMKEKTAQFDAEIEAETNEHLAAIRKEMLAKSNDEIARQKTESRERLAKLEADFEARHEAMSREIAERIIRG